MEKKNQQNMIFFEEPKTHLPHRVITEKQLKQAVQETGLDGVHNLHPIEEVILEEKLKRLKVGYPKVI